MIARELTPRGAGGVAVIEIAGEGALARASRVLGEPRLAPGRLVRLALAFDGEVLDDALVWCESDARLELHLHGSPVLVERVLGELARAGLGADETRGPRSPRGPRSLEERARELLPRAASLAGARMLLEQAEGALRAELLRARTLEGAALRACLAQLARRARLARFQIDGARVVLAGVVNAGKSTLFNALVGEERAIVTPEAGTTRDVIRARALLGEWPAWILDTAGERALAPGTPEAEVEAAGQALARRAREAADVVLWLRPTDAASPPPPPGAIEVWTRADLAAGGVPEPEAGGARLSARDDPRGAAGTVARVVREALGLPERAWERGAGVPFEPWMAAELARAADGLDRTVIERLLAAR